MPGRPGFVDLQVNGFGGVDFSAPSLRLEDVRSVVHALEERGTIAFCPTVITGSEDTYRANLPILARAMREPDLAPHILGIHLEGPFISPVDGARGAHPLAHVREPDTGFYDRLRGWSEDRVVLVTLAPERPGAEALVRHVRKSGAVVSLGHHLATRDDIARACDAGATAVTHLGNGVPNLLPRHPNPLWDQLDETRLHAMVIADGHHVPEGFLRVVARVKGAGAFIAVSDAAPIAGLPPGRYRTVGQDVVLESSGRLWNPERGHLVGSSATLLDCMNHLARVTAFSEEDLWCASHDNPLRLISRALEGASASVRRVRSKGRVFELATP